MKTDATTVKKKARTALLHTVIKDALELETVASRAAATQLSRDALIIEQDLALAAIKEQFSKSIDELESSLKSDVAAMESYSLRNRSTLFSGDSKTITVLGHELSLRTSPGKVECVKGNTIKSVEESLLSHPDEEFAEKFLKYTATLNKDAVLAQWETSSAELTNLGLVVTKPELFAFKPARTAMPSTMAKGTTRKEVEAA